MKHTEHYGLNLLDSADSLSYKSLNDNAEKIENILQEQEAAISGKLMMAAGSYTGSGTRTVTIQPPGFTPKAMVIRRARRNSWINQQDQSLWVGQTIQTQYKIVASSNNPPSGYSPDEPFETFVSAEITFSAEAGKLSWTIPDIPQDYYDVTTDEGPAAINNSAGEIYQWIAFGVAE